MFVLRYLPGTLMPVYDTSVRKYVKADVGGKYVRHTWSFIEANVTTDLQRAKVYNTAAGAKRHSDAEFCEVVPVLITLE